MSERVTQDPDSGELVYRGFRATLSVHMEGFDGIDGGSESDATEYPIIKGAIVGIPDTIHFFTRDLGAIARAFQDAVEEYQEDLKTLGRTA